MNYTLFSSSRAGLEPSALRLIQTCPYSQFSVLDLPYFFLYEKMLPVFHTLAEHS